MSRKNSLPKGIERRERKDGTPFYLVRWMTSDGTRPSKSFSAIHEAVLFQEDIIKNPARREGTLLLREYWDEFLGYKSYKPNSLTAVKHTWKRYVEPRWGYTPVSEINRRDVEIWVAQLAAQPSVALKALSCLRMVSAMAPYPPNLSNIRSTPPAPKANIDPVDEADVKSLAEVCRPFHLMIWTPYTTAVRWGELAGLRERDLDAPALRLHIRTQVSGNAMTRTVPKSRRGVRRVPIPEWVVAEILPRLTGDPDAPLFPTMRGKVWREQNFIRQVLGPARKKTGLLDFDMHHLRHTYACRAIEQGMDLKTLQYIMGHSTLSLTIDLYGDRANAKVDDFAGLFARDLTAGTASDPDL